MFHDEICVKLISKYRQSQNQRNWLRNTNCTAPVHERFDHPLFNTSFWIHPSIYQIWAITYNKKYQKYNDGLVNELNISVKCRKFFYISSSCQCVGFDTDKDRKLCLIFSLSTCYIFSYMDCLWLSKMFQLTIG